MSSLRFRVKAMVTLKVVECTATEQCSSRVVVALVESNECNAISFIIRTLLEVEQSAVVIFA